MLSLKQKVNNMQEDISKILKAQKEILERQEDILEYINDLKKEEKLTQLEIEQLDKQIITKYFDLRMFIIQKCQAIRRMYS